MSGQPVEQHASDEPTADEPVSPAVPYTEAPPPKKIADRPHAITIAIGLISPSLAVLALVMSIKSIAISRQSLQVGQRAYVHADLLYRGVEPVSQRGEFVLVLKNDGNTPASLGKETAAATDGDCTGDASVVYPIWWMTYRYSTKGTGEKKCPYPPPESRNESGRSLEAKGSVEFPVVLLEIPSMKKEDEYGVDAPHIDITLFYLDVFQVRHKSEVYCRVQLFDKKYIPDCTSMGD